MNIKKLLGQDSHWQVNKELARKVGIEPALLLSEIIDSYEYFTERNELVEYDNILYYFQTAEKIKEKTGLSYKKQKSCIDILVKNGFIKTTLKGIPAKLHFNICEDNVLLFFNLRVNKVEKQECTKGKNLNDEKVNTIYKEYNNKENNNKESNIFTNITTHTSNAKNLQERECDFQNLVYSELQERTEKEEIDKFILYWTEPNKSKSKMKFESEKFFDVKRRFVTWIGNVKPKYNQPTYTNKKNNLDKSDMLQVIQGMDKYQLGDFIKKYYNSFYTQMISDSRLDDENTRRGAVEWLINTKQPENI